MLFYSLIIYLSVLFFDNSLNTKYFILYTSLISGLAIATKISSVVFMGVPLIVIINSKVQLKIQKFFTFNFLPLFLTFAFLLLTLTFALIFSPHNLINYQDFLSSFRYESAVATGQIKVFYTRQFEGTVPYLFQAIKIFPYTLGWPIYILSLLGFIFLHWNDKRLNFVRLAVLIYFIPSGYIFAKWSRFTAPILPLMLIFAILLILEIIHRVSKIYLKNQKFYIFICRFAFCILIFNLILPGLLYLSVYQKSDVRFQATDWINKNIPENSLVLSETANVVDIPLTDNKNLDVISFNFYDLDENKSLQTDLKNYLSTADYIFVPSRRIFSNHPQKKYPLLYQYYDNLFSGKSGFKQVAEFSSGLNDEGAEETWTVFDHPVIRIYKRISNIKSQISKPQLKI